MKETGVPGKNHRTVASHWQTLSHTVVLIAQIVGFTYEHNHPTWFDYWITNIIINTHSFAVSSATCTIIKELKYYCYYWYSSLQYEMQVWSGQYSPIGFIFIIEDSICGFLIVQADWCHKGKTNKKFHIYEWVSYHCFKPNETFFSHIMARTSYNQWDDDVRYILHQFAYW